MVLGSGIVDVLKWLRMLAATAEAVIGGVVTMASGPSEPAVVLRPGDPAPDFTLPGSDGRVYHLQEVLAQGSGVVIAWFPKAFTPG